MNDTTRKAVVLIPSCSNLVGGLRHPSHTVQRKYADAVFYGAHCTPLLIPAMGQALDVDALLNVADGVFLSGSPSNVNASLYGEENSQPQLPQDIMRDDVTIPLIKAAMKRNMPIFGVCRGFQEINVALGGTLYQSVHDLIDFEYHIDLVAQTAEDIYSHSHPAYIVADGELNQILHKSQLMVNSVHGQGVKQLALGLTAQAHAPDGLIEAFSVSDYPTFGMAVQWHPEWKMTDNPDSIALFQAFGKACHTYHQTKNDQQLIHHL
jgi:putative glutamine amidotransferase